MNVESTFKIAIYLKQVREFIKEGPTTRPALLEKMRKRGYPTLKYKTLGVS